ncbi:hypothetical protein OAF54_02950 [bacterium]|nr:hypothetical protein [bacterium]
MPVWRTSDHHPKPGDKKKREKFAWLPVDTDNGWTVWLGNYWVEYEYVTDYECHSYWEKKRVFIEGGEC